jgi:hypothetical protein
MKNLVFPRFLDSADIEGVIKDIEVLKERFAELMDEAKKDYLVLLENKTQDKAVEAVLQHFMDEEKRFEFYQLFEEISDIYEIMSPDKFLRPYLEDMETLARMYRILREAFEPGISVDKNFSRKTAELVQQYTRGSKIKPALDIYEINGETLRLIEESNASDTEKVFNLLRSIEQDVEENVHREPYMISIGEKAEAIAQRYKNRQMDTQETLEDVKKLIDERIAARKEQEE